MMTWYSDWDTNATLRQKTLIRTGKKRECGDPGNRNGLIGRQSISRRLMSLPHWAGPTTSLGGLSLYLGHGNATLRCLLGVRMVQSEPTATQSSLESWTLMRLAPEGKGLRRSQTSPSELSVSMSKNKLFNATRAPTGHPNQLR